MSSRDVTIRNAQGHKQCFRCRGWFPEDMFGPRPGATDGLRGVCTPCIRTYKNQWRSKRDRKADALWDAHKMTWEEFVRLVEDQGGTCAICPTHNPTHVDHDHLCCSGQRSCGKCTRGILCHQCNTMLGMAKDSPEILRSGADYLERAASS